MKKTLCILLFAAVLLGLTGCIQTGIPLPDYQSEETYFESDNNALLYTDFAKYYYQEGDEAEFEDSSYFTQVKADDVDNLRGYVEDYNLYICDEPSFEHYDFDISQIKEGDYFYLYTMEGMTGRYQSFEKYDCYTLYYYDTEKYILYLMHNNIKA